MPYKDKDREREYQREYQRQRRAGSQDDIKPIHITIPAEQRIQTADEVFALLTEQVELVRADSRLRTVERARCVGYLCSILLRTIEAQNLAQRLEAVEQALRLRDAA